MREWIAISRGAAGVQSNVAARTTVAVAALWLGDVIGWGSPLGKRTALYDITAIVDTATINISPSRLVGQSLDACDADSAALYAATAARIQAQVAMRLAGNGIQRLVSVLTTLAQALTPTLNHRQAQRLSLPVAQACLGALAGLSRRQTWIYLGQLAEAGWVETGRTKVTLLGLRAWLALPAVVIVNGLECIDSVGAASETLSRLTVMGAQGHARLDQSANATS